MYNISYNLVFCPRYKRKIFLINGLQTRFKEVVIDVCQSYAMELKEIRFGADYVYLLISANPQMSVSSAVAKIKAATARAILSEFDEFAKTQNVWTRNFLASTSFISPEEINSFVNQQVSHY